MRINCYGSPARYGISIVTDNGHQGYEVDDSIVKRHRKAVAELDAAEAALEEAWSDAVQREGVKV